MDMVDHTINKGMDKGSEMFSAFADVFGNKSSRAVSEDLAALLKSHGTTHVFICGIAGDYCVKCTALDARKEGFKVFVVEDAVRSVDPSDQAWRKSRKEMESADIKIATLKSADLARVLKSQD